MREMTDRNKEIAKECKALEAKDIKYAKQKIAEKYGISERRVWAILRTAKFKELLEDDKN